MNIQCKTEIPAVPGLPDQELSVGREFLLVCDGEWSRELNVEKLHFIKSDQQKYVIKLLGFEFRSSTTADLKVTSYTAGEVKIPNLRLTDDTQTVDLGELNFAVKSVLPPPDPNNPEVKQEPFGPMGPAQLPIPPVYWAMLVGAIVLLALMIGFKAFRYFQRRRMLEDLREHDAAVSPLVQFHQGFRRLQRQNQVFFGIKDPAHEDILSCLDGTNQMLRLYLTRRFQVPAMKWSDRLILRDIRRYHPGIFAENGDDLGKLFKEYSRAFKDKEHLEATDVLSISSHCRVLVERMERHS